MSDDISSSDTDTSNLNPASADTSGADQSQAANAGTGTVDTATSSGADQANPSQADTDSNSAKDPLDRFTEQVRANRGSQVQETNASAQTQAQSLTMDQINQALGLKGPEDLKRIVNERSLMGRQANELGQLRQQMSELQKQQQAERTRQEQEAQKANLSPFHAKHPQYQANQARIAKAAAFDAMAGALDPNDPKYSQTYNAMAARAGVTREDLALMKQQQAYGSQIRAEQEADPEGFVEARAARLIDSRLAQFDQYLNNRMQAQSFVQQHQDLINDPKMQQVMAEALDERTSRSQLAVKIATLEREKAELLAKATTETAEVETLRAQQELAGRQTLTRRRASTSTTTESNPWAAYEAAKNDPTASQKLLDKLFKR